MRYRRAGRSIAIDGSLLPIAMLMLSPMTSRSHYVALLLPYMTLLAHNWRHQRTGRLGRAVLATSFALVTLAGNDAVGEAFTVWAYRHSAMVLGTLVLLIYFAALVMLRQVNSSDDFTWTTARPRESGDPAVLRSIFSLAIWIPAVAGMSGSQYR